MTGEETFSFFVPGFSMGSLNTNELSPWEMAEETLNRYENEVPGSQKHMLYSNKDDVVRVLCRSNEVRITSKIYLLELDIGCP